MLNGDLCYTHANEVLARIFRVRPVLLLNRRVEEFLPTIPGKVLSRLRRIVAEGRGKVSVDLKSAGGRGKSMTWSLTFEAYQGLEGDDGVIMVAAVIAAPPVAPAEDLNDQAAFQELLTGLSTEFINIPADRVDTQIEQGLRRLVEFMGVQRSTFGEINGDGHALISHCYAAPGIPRLSPMRLDTVLPWFASMIREGRIISFSKVDELPPEAVEERRVSASSGIKANLTIPFSVGGMPMCALGVGSTRERHWPQDYVPRLRLAGEIFANAIARKRADEDLQRMRESLAHITRVSTVGHLATSIAHEINQPLCGMLSNAEAATRFLGGGRPDIGEAVEALAAVISDGKRASEVIARTHELLRRHSVVLSPQDLSALIEVLKPVLSNYSLLHRIGLRFELAPGLQPVLGHGIQLQQVVTNLLVNGIEACVAAKTQSGCVALNTSFDKDAGAVVVRVSDNGIGLSHELAASMFDPFVTSKPNGLGMGLSISRTIIEAHRGRLWAEPNADGGATFCFSVPVCRETT